MSQVQRTKTKSQCGIKFNKPETNVKYS